MYRLIHNLSPLDRERLVTHFLTLDEEDRRLRFGGALPDDMIRDYVNAIDFQRDRLFAAFDTSFDIIAVAHVGLVDGKAEIGLSVLRGYRREGLAVRLIQRARKSATAHGCQQLWIHFMCDNAAMGALVRKLGMTVKASLGEADALLDLPDASAVAVGVTLYEERLDALLGVWRQWLPQAA
jgi:ribosomal protein S18 acetylase RimI-like enzyme